MNKIYIVCENIIENYIPEPIDYNRPTPLESSFLDGSSRIGMPIITPFPLKPRFDPIIPQFYPEPKKYSVSKPNNIVYVCKDLDTAKHYLVGNPNRYIIGPYDIV